MPSPFPGMDPYIEAHGIWPDFHNNLASEMQSRLNAQILPEFVAVLEPYVVYETVEIRGAQVAFPDLGVFESERAPGLARRAATAIPPAPVRSIVPLEAALRLHRVEIRQAGTETLVTAIEILSPANKRSGSVAQRKYLAKRRDYFNSTANLMEVDLLRGGERPPLTQPVPDAPYYIVVSRANLRPEAEVWPIQLADALPLLPVPLLPAWPDVPLDLSAAFAAIYERTGYGARIDYRQPPPPPPLSPAEAGWVDDLMRREN
jgi:hypothetical protein